MTDDTLAATITIAAPAEAVFAVLTDPASHPAIDGTGWVSKALDTAPLTGSCKAPSVLIAPVVSGCMSGPAGPVGGVELGSGSRL
jgi:hypothetical protein